MRRHFQFDDNISVKENPNYLLVLRKNQTRTLLFDMIYFYLKKEIMYILSRTNNKTCKNCLWSRRENRPRPEIVSD